MAHCGISVVSGSIPSMKRQRSPSPADARHRIPYILGSSNETNTERQYTPNNFDGLQSQRAGDNSILSPFSELHNTYESQYGTNASVVPDHSILSRGTVKIEPNPHFLDRTSSSANFASGTYSNLLGTPSRAEPSQAGGQLLEARGGQIHSQYNSPHPPPTYETQTPSMHNQGWLSHYAPFAGSFLTTESAAAYRKEATRFGRRPYRPPDSDPTIEAIAKERQVHVGRIYNAMTRSDMAKDNEGSIAMRRWAHAAHYPSDLVESVSHKVFDCLLDQVRNGFRGWTHNDYASDDRKGEPEDKNVSCAERLDNVCRGLEEEKTICEDVMSSSCQIRMFVNAPRAYARRKEANRHGNSKRGKATTKPETRGAKARRLNTRQSTRLQQAGTYSATPPSSTARLPPPPLDLASPKSQPLGHYYTPQPRAAQLSRPTPTMTHSDSQIRAASSAYISTGMSPAQPHGPHLNPAHFTAGSPQNQTPYLHSPVMRHGLPTTSDQPRCTNTLSTSWPQTNDLGTLTHPFYLQGVPPPFETWELPSQQHIGSTPHFHDPPLFGPQDPPNRYMNPSDMNIDPSFRSDNVAGFPEIWNSNPNVQPFPLDQPEEGEKKPK